LNETKHTGISIIVPNYNNGQYLASFINSVISSTIEPLELIIVDDGSEDNSVEVLNEFNHLPYLKLILFKTNKGLTTALNTALDICTGDFVMRADPDDRLAPERMEQQLNYMLKNPDIDVVGCNVVYFHDKTGKPINNSNFPLNHAAILESFKRGEHGLQHPTAFAKGEVYRKYRYQKIFPGEDYEIFSRMIRDGHKFANLKGLLYYMRVHGGSATSNLKRQHIITTFEFRDTIFGTKSKKSRIWLYYHYMLNYRKYQRAQNPLLKCWYLILSGICYPSKVFKRISGS
jgi:glycosyltransferase involved in cell wall biosynthesis